MSLETVAATTGAEVEDSSMAVVLKPSSVAIPAASPPKAGLLTMVLPPFAGSSSRSDGSGTIPALASVTTKVEGAPATGAGAIWKVWMESRPAVAPGPNTCSAALPGPMSPAFR